MQYTAKIIIRNRIVAEYSSGVSFANAAELASEIVYKDLLDLYDHIPKQILLKMFVHRVYMPEDIDTYLKSKAKFIHASHEIMKPRKIRNEVLSNIYLFYLYEDFDLKIMSTLSNEFISSKATRIDDPFSIVRDDVYLDGHSGLVVANQKTITHSTASL